MSKVGIIGAGAWGTTLAILLAENKHEVRLWIYEKELVAETKRLRENKKYLPGFQLPLSIEITAEPEDLNGCDYYFFVVPTQFLRSAVKQFSRIIDQGAILISASKGIEERSLNLPLEIIKEELKSQNLAVLSGPNLSFEIAKGLPAATVVAAKEEPIASKVQRLLMLERFRVYTNSDVVGVQLSGALKNVIAIAAGIVDGLKLGDNAKAGLLIRGMVEISRLGVAMGGRAETFAGLAGMGDLITTCSSKLSRNHFVGEQIAQGRKLPEILLGMKDIAEGIPTTLAASDLGKKYEVCLPITAEVHKILYKGKDPYLAISDLMQRGAKSE